MQPYYKTDEEYLTSKDDGNSFGKILLAVLFSLAFLLCIAFFFSSCNSAARLAKNMAKRPDVSMRLCDRMFPATTSETTKTEYVPGQTIYDTAVVYVDCDSVLESSKLRAPNSVQIKRVRVPCPVSTHRVDSIIRTVTITKTNTIHERQLQKDLDKATADAERLQKGRNTWRIIGCVGILLLLGGTALKIFTKKLG